MEPITEGIKTAFSALGSFSVWFFGKGDGFLYTLIAFVIIDYITGVMCTITDKKFSDTVGLRCIFRKLLIFTMTGIGNIIDMYVLDIPGVLRTAIIFFYLSNEGASLLENTAHPGLPVPYKLTNILKQIHEKEPK